VSTPFTPHPHDDLAAYALDALEPRERVEVARHLLGCPECEREVDELRATAARLVSPIEPPPHVWEQIVDGLAFRSEVRPGASTGRPDQFTDLAGARGGGDTPGGRVTPGAGRRRLQRPRRNGAIEGPWAAGGVPGRPGTSSSRAASLSSPSHRWLAPVLAAAAAVALVAGAVGFLSGRSLDGSTTTGGVDDLAAAAFADDANGRAVLVDEGGNEVAQVVADGSSGYLTVDALAAPDDGRTFQLWRLDGAAPVSLGVLGSVGIGGEASAVAFPLPTSPVGSVAELAITSEPLGGSTAPVGHLVASGTLPLAT
jgi:anti-sigma-K factor RskA